MGVIIEQSIKNTTVNFIGLFVGAINLLIIYERILTPEELGKLKFITSTPALLLPFVLLGTTSSMIRFFPRFEDKSKKYYGILGYGLIIVLVGFLLYLGLTIFFFEFLPEKFKESYQLISLLLLLIVFSGLLTTYLNTFKKIYVPAIFNNLLIKLGSAFVVIIFYFEYISFSQLLEFIVFLYSISLLGLLFYTIWLKKFFIKPNRKILTKEFISDFKTYSFYSILGPIGVVLITNLDQYMVTELMDFEYGGIYTIGVYFTTLFTIPMMSVFSIANPIISKYSDTGDYYSIKEIYQKSSINLMIFGIFIFFCLWINIDDIFSLMSNSEIYSKGKYVIFFLAIAKLIDMVTSVNGSIIAHSKHFRFNLIAMVILGLSNIVANYYFINQWGLEGAAIASLISIILFNFAKFIFVWVKFKIQPFTENTLKLLLVGFLIVLFIMLVPKIDISPLINICLSCFLLSSVYILSVYYSNISVDFNSVLNASLVYIKKRLK